MREWSDESVWQTGVTVAQFPPLTADAEADVAVIGAGITGMTAAYFLSEAGYRVVVLEQERVGAGATQLTTAFLTQYLDTALTDLIKLYGREATAALMASQGFAIDTIERIVKEEKIECEFKRCSNYIFSSSAAGKEGLEAEQRAAEEIDLGMNWQPGELPITHGGYVELMNQGKFHPLKYIAALSDILKERGVHIFEQTEVFRMTPGEHVIIHTADHAVRAANVVVATHTPFDKNGRLFFKKGLYTTYVVEATLPSGAVPEAIYEDTHNPYHYFRVDQTGEHDRLILGGADHRSDIPVNSEKNLAALNSFMQKTFSGISYKIERAWSGPIVEPVDGLAYIGPVEENNIFYATGFSGNGMTYGTLAARIIADLIEKRDNPWFTLYEARRRPSIRQLAYKGRDYAGELFGGAVRNTLKYRA